MLEDTISNLRWAMAFSVGTTILNLISVVGFVYASAQMRKAMRTWRELSERLRNDK